MKKTKDGSVEIKEENLEKLKNIKNKNFYTAIKHAIDGVICAFKTERNLRIDYVIGLLVLITSLFFDFTKTEFACLCLTIGFVIFAEMINSTVEYVVDLITDKYDDRAKAAKDIAAGGVFVSALVAVVVSYFLFADKIYMATNSVLSSILDSKIYILFTIMFAVIILVVILKGFFSKKKGYVATYPSVRVTLAFAMTTYVYLVTKRMLVGFVALVLSIIIAQIKVEDQKTKVGYMIFSALLGVLLVLIIYQIVLLRPYLLDFLTI
ncbi:MAG: diacylglycerol kinase [Clostridia bacterium]